MNRQTNGRTDEQTDGQTGRKHYASRQSSLELIQNYSKHELIYLGGFGFFKLLF